MINVCATHICTGYGAGPGTVPLQHHPCAPDPREVACVPSQQQAVQPLGPRSRAAHESDAGEKAAAAAAAAALCDDDVHGYPSTITGSPALVD
jgi:hypothetical protein